ncbi:MAG TPA: carboxypeptidase regulatory-like domain-containing protein [Planctomycetota bacterium]|nr:carboxypeptidase regulatory-like domain-containing protein [Planctomycetota bacterium]
MANAALAATSQGQAEVRGKALSTSGQPVAGVKVTLTYQMPDAPKESWSATTSAGGTFSLKIPGNKSLGLAIEAPPGGKLAPCAVHAAGSLRVSPGQVQEVTIFLAPATARLAGTVTDPDKRPIAGAQVALAPAQHAAWFSCSVTTDKAGRYESPALAPGSYVVRSVEPPAGTGYVRLSTWKPGGVRAVNLGDGRTATEDFVLPRGARLTGRVLDEAGKPLAGAQVSCRLDAATEVGKRSVYQMSGQWYRGEATTNAAGAYSLGGLTQETYCVEVRPPEGKELAPAAVRGVNAPEEGDVKLQDVTLYKGGTLVGKVLGADGKPVEGAEVAFSLPLGWRGTRVTGKTDAAGKVEFRGLASGQYTMTVQPPEGSVSCQKQFDDVRALSGLTLEQTLKLPEGAKVTGTVTGPDGKPVAGATVMASYGYASRAKGTTDAQGRYVVAGLAPPAKLGPPQRYGPQNQVTAVAPAEALTLATSSVPLPLIPLGGSAKLDITLKPGVAITGRVTGPGGTPVASAQVGVYRYTRGSIQGFGSVFTDEQGRYTIGHLLETAMSVTVDPPEGLKLLRKAVAEKRFEPGKLSTVDVALETGATLVGEVVTSKGKPVVGAQVRVQATTGQYPRANRVAMSGVGGAFRAEALPPGPYEIHCTPPDATLRAKPTTFTIQGKGEERTKVVLYLTGSLTGTVRDGKGNALGRGACWLSLQSKEAGPQAQQAGAGHLDEQGRYTIGGLPPGAYTVRVSLGRAGQEKKLMSPAPAEIVIEEGKETKHDVTVPYGPEGKATKF